MFTPVLIFAGIFGGFLIAFTVIFAHFVSFIFLETGYQLLQLEEYITGVDGCEKYDLGVLTYLGTPATAGYSSLFCLS